MSLGETESLGILASGLFHRAPQELSTNAIWGFLLASLFVYCSMRMSAASQGNNCGDVSGWLRETNMEWGAWLLQQQVQGHWIRSRGPITPIEGGSPTVFHRASWCAPIISFGLLGFLGLCLAWDFLRSHACRVSLFCIFRLEGILLRFQIDLRE